MDKKERGDKIYEIFMKICACTWNIRVLSCLGFIQKYKTTGARLFCPDDVDIDSIYYAVCKTFRNVDAINYFDFRKGTKNIYVCVKSEYLDKVDELDTILKMKGIE